MCWLRLLLMTEDVERSNQQCHVYSIHSSESDKHAKGIIDKNDISLRVLTASPADEKTPGASCNIPGSLQVQCYNSI
jgi:hypothetical protein